MATVVNARDVFLQGATQRLIGIDLPPNINIPVDNIPALVGVSLTASSQLFQIPNSGVAYPAAIVLKAIVRGLTVTPTLSITSGTMTVTPAFDSGLQFTFTEAQMTSDVVVFKAEAIQPDPLGGPSTTYSDTFTVLKVREGEGSVVGFLTNENATLTADKDGNVTSYTGASGSFVVIKGITNVSGSCTFAVQANPQNLTVTINSAGAYSVTGGFASSNDTASVTFRATFGTLTLDKTLTLSKAKSGANGAAGAAGDKTVTVNLYAWSVSQPSNPNGSSSYDWLSASHTAYSGAAPWSTSIGSNPGGSSVKLWVASKAIVASGSTTSSTVTWPSSGVGYSVYASNENGAAGLQRAEAVVYQWAASIPAGTTGSDVYSWAGTSPATTFNGPSGIGSVWFYTPGTAPSPGFTLWAAKKLVSDSAQNSTTNFNWTGASITAVGYAGANGGAGAAGAQGVSATTAYARISGNPSPVVGNIATVGLPTSAQSNSAWGLNVTWSYNDPNPASTSTLYQTDGFYNPANGITTWNTPYISSLKVGSLSAVAVNTGSLNVDGTFTMTSAGMINQGAYAGYAWPSSGSGFHLGPQGLLMGNYNTGGYVEIKSDGSIVDIGKAGGPRLLWNTAGGGSLTLSGASLSAGSISGGSISGTSVSGGTISGTTITGGTISGTSISGGVITGSTFQTSSTGTRVVISSANNNAAWYDGSELACFIGTQSNFGYGAFGVGSSNKTGVYGVSGSGDGIQGSSTSGRGGVFFGGAVGVRGDSTSGPGVWGATNGAGSAVYGTSFGSGAAGYFAASGSGIGGIFSSATNYSILATGDVLFQGTFRVNGGFSCNSKNPQGSYSVNAPCTDLATAIALINQLRAALVANGICV